MGLQLGFKEASDIIIRAINMASDNLNTHLYHKYSTTGHQGFYAEIKDLDITTKLEKMGVDFDDSDCVFTLNLPYDFFNDDKLSIDDGLGINATDDIEVKAEIRCIDFIERTYNNWILSHGVFIMKDLMKVINKALYKLQEIKHLDFAVASSKGETAEKYCEIWFTERHIPQTGGSFTDRFFPVEFHLKDYYAVAGDHPLDSALGTQKLKNKSREELCLLRVSYALYHEFTGWLHNKGPQVYAKFKRGEF